MPVASSIPRGTGHHLHRQRATQSDAEVTKSHTHGSRHSTASACAQEPRALAGLHPTPLLSGLLPLPSPAPSLSALGMARVNFPDRGFRGVRTNFGYKLTPNR